MGKGDSRGRLRRTPCAQALTDVLDTLLHERRLSPPYRFNFRHKAGRIQSIAHSLKKVTQSIGNLTSQLIFVIWQGNTDSIQHAPIAICNNSDKFFVIRGASVLLKLSLAVRNHVRTWPFRHTKPFFISPGLLQMDNDRCESSSTINCFARQLSMKIGQSSSVFLAKLQAMLGMPSPVYPFRRR